MRKLKLEIEDLAVESFATGDAGELAGTVKGRNAAYGEDEVLEPGIGHEEVGIIVTISCICTVTCPVITYCASCVNTCDACTARTCPSGGDICCA